MSHQKRQIVPKNWPIPRKGTAYVVRPNSNGIPILVILRDMLRVARNKKEVKKALHESKILINNKIVKDEKNCAVLFDSLTIIPSKKSYRLTLSEKGKFMLEEIKETESKSKISKVINKKTLKGKKTQLNLSDGRNFLSEMKCGVNDSVVINFETKKIEKCLELKEKVNVVIFAGKHAGKKGILKTLKPERKMAKVSTGDQEINVLIEQIMAVQ